MLSLNSKANVNSSYNKFYSLIILAVAIVSIKLLFILQGWVAGGGGVVLADSPHQLWAGEAGWHSHLHEHAWEFPPHLPRCCQESQLHNQLPNITPASSYIKLKSLLKFLDWAILLFYQYFYSFMLITWRLSCSSATRVYKFGRWRPLTLTFAADSDCARGRQDHRELHQVL